ncbi:sensor domain-containing diguanylate cyclase [Shewanella denitrificans]|jgi:diguanylate cyclase|nr:GGDEF domain-containing protein [Shewanella denitrificans]
MKTMPSLHKWPVNIFSWLCCSLILGLGCCLLLANQAIANVLPATQTPAQLIHTELTQDAPSISILEANQATIEEIIEETSQETAAAEIALLFDEAQRYRGTDGAKSSAILQRLEKLRHNLSQEQAYYLDYLQAYQQGILGKHDIALNTLLNVFNNTQSTELKFQSGHTIFNVLAISRRFVEALSYYNQTMALYSQVSDGGLRATSLFAGMMLFNELGDYERVISIRQHSDLATLSEGLRCKADAFLIRAESNLGPSDKVLPFEQGLALCRSAGQPLYESFIRLYYVRFLLANSQYMEAKTELEAHLATSLSTQYKLIIQEYYYLMAKTYWLLGNEAEATLFAERALETSVSEQYSLPLTLSLELSYQMAKQRGDFELALQYAEQYAQADKGYLNQLRVKAMALEMNKAEMLEQQQRIEILKRENQLLTLAQALERKENVNVQLLIVVLLLCLLSVCIWAYRSKRIQSELARLAQVDELTQVFNRRQLVLLGGQVLALAERNKTKVSVIMVDLDFFKSINDRFGHNVGDWALRRVAETLNALGRKSDVFGRLGGEEFAFVLSDCALEQALDFAELCRNEIATIDVSDSLFPGALSLTASFGVTETGLSGYDLEGLLSDADQALYQAKDSQRNCVVKFEAHPITNESDVATDAARDEVREGVSDATTDGTTSVKIGEATDATTGKTVNV